MLEAVTSNGGSSKRSPPESRAEIRHVAECARSADEMGVYNTVVNSAIPAKTAHKGNKSPELKRKVPHFLPHRSPPVRSRSRGVVPFDPAKARQRDAEADAVIAYAKRVKDWPTLHAAVDQKIEDQTAYVAWWRTTVTPNVGAGRGNKNQRRAGLVLQSDAEALTGISHQQVARWRQRLANVEAYRARLYGAAYRLAMYGEAARFRSGDDEWYTPAAVIDLARDVLGGIDLDPASNAEAQKIIRAKRYFAQTDQGLSRPWPGRVWLNPPYSQPRVAEFVAKLIDERRCGRVTSAILLTNNCTDTRWFHAALECADVVTFTRGRIAFCKASGESGAPSPQGQVFFYFGDASERFIGTFASLGTSVRRVPR
jgi:phage N-6-adenine-methyltransferase